MQRGKPFLAGAVDDVHRGRLGSRSRSREVEIWERQRYLHGYWQIGGLLAGHHVRRSHWLYSAYHGRGMW